MEISFESGLRFRGKNIWNLPITEFDDRWSLFNYIIEKYFEDTGLNFSKSNPCRFLEIGVWQASTLPRVVQHFGKIFDYVGVDPYGSLVDDPYKGQFWETNDEAEKVFQSANATFERHGAELVRLTSKDFFQSNNSLFDIIFVDGDHRYATALEDMETALERLKDGGLLIVDDLANNFHPEVEWAVRDFLNAKKERFDRSGVQPLFFQLPGMPVPVMLMFAYMRKKI
jgi:hypothetical protein